VRFFTAFLFTATIAAAESHPAWWSFASPEATALVGIHWENLRQSAFADAVGAELSSSGNLGFPDLRCLRESKQILLSSPALLGIAAGNFPAPVLRAEAVSKGLKPAVYRDVPLWISPGKNTLSIAQISDQLLLIGLRKTLEAAIDRSLAETGRRYSPLLARAARFALAQDLWVLATQLPDPLASLFVPVDAEAQSFEGAISLRDGLRVEAVFDAGSEQAAAQIAEKLRQEIPGLPVIARGLQVTAAADSVLVAMQVSRDQLSASLRTESEPVKPTEPPKPTGPQVIRILGLDEGPREIVLPPVKEKN
jgi:hypothetical protein